MLDGPLSRRLFPHVILGLLGSYAASALADAEDTPPGGGPPLPAVDITQFLPVRTATLRPGLLETEHRPTGVTRPFFLLGCDGRSLEWLKRNRKQLIVLGAVGLVVEAPDAIAYRNLELIGEGLVLRPVSGDLIAEHLGLQNYPALITNDGIFQSVLP